MNDPLVARPPGRPRSVPAFLGGCAAVLVLVLALGGCGGASGGVANEASGGGFAEGLPIAGQKRGGTLKILGAESFTHMDPGQVYFQLDYMVAFATQRALYYFRPEDPKTEVPDLAVGPPVVSAD